MIFASGVNLLCIGSFFFKLHMLGRQFPVASWVGRWIHKKVELKFLQIDAFSSRPLFGNPAAVVLGADERIPTATLQRIACEKNLSETVFIFPPTSDQADYRVRIFTPRSELPFAGHPTIAAAHVVLSEFPAKKDAVLLRQECGIGIVPVEVFRDERGTTLVMTQASPTFKRCDVDEDAIARLLGCDKQALTNSPFEVISTGVPWLVIQLKGLDVISTIVPDQSAIASFCANISAVGITVFCQLEDESGYGLRVRTFAPGEGVLEDPVCGSGNGSVAAFLAKHVFADRTEFAYRAEQGIEIGRDGEVQVSWSRNEDRLEIKVGGKAAVSARGHLYFELDSH